MEMTISWVFGDNVYQSCKWDSGAAERVQGYMPQKDKILASQVTGASWEVQSHSMS